MYDSECPWSGKRGYFSRATAESEMRRLRKHGPRQGKKLIRSYRCDCGDYHLTSEKENHGTA
jgi:hypothetical protein